MVTTPNMGLDMPDVGDDGTEYASRLVEVVQDIDAHDHTEDSGVPIPSAGIDIDADLEANGFSITELESTAYENRAAALTGASNARRLYFVGGELYATDGDGLEIQITSNGEVDSSAAGSVGGMGGTDAAITYNSSNQSFQFLQDDTDDTAADLDASVLKLRSETPGDAVYTSLARNATQLSNVALTLPSSLPLATSVVTMTSAGVLATTRSPTLDNPSIASPTITSSGTIASAGVSGNFTVAGRLAIGTDDTHGERTVNYPALVGDANGGSFTFVNGNWTSSASSQRCIIPLTLRVGDRIKSITFKFDPSASATYTFTLLETTAGTIWTASPSKSGSLQTYELTGTAQTVAASEYYFAMFVSGGSSDDYHGAMVKTDRP
jgi:hypothetical protein